MTPRELAVFSSSGGWLLLYWHFYYMCFKISGGDWHQTWDHL